VKTVLQKENARLAVFLGAGSACHLAGRVEKEIEVLLFSTAGYHCGTPANDLLAITVREPAIVKL
jgi:hypothetical protein